MPAVYQGIRIQGGNEPIPNLNTPDGITQAQQLGKLDMLNRLNRNYAQKHPLQTELDARLRSYELAFRMQTAAPEAVDLNHETEETKKLYGFEQKETASMARLCLLPAEWWKEASALFRYTMGQEANGMHTANWKKITANYAGQWIALLRPCLST